MKADVLDKARVARVVQALPSLSGHDSPAGTIERLAKDPDIKNVLADYYRVVEIAHHVRRGGIRAMLYRLETGKTEFVSVDYFDQAQERLAHAFQRLYKHTQIAERPLADRLKEIAPEEEDAVREVLAELDGILLHDKRAEAVLIDDP